MRRWHILDFLFYHWVFTFAIFLSIMTFSFFFPWVTNLDSGFRLLTSREPSLAAHSVQYDLNAPLLCLQVSLCCVFTEIYYEFYFTYLSYSQILYNSFIQQLRCSILIHLKEFTPYVRKFSKVPTGVEFCMVLICM